MAARLNLSPRSERIAYQVYWTAKPMGWSITLQDLAEEIGESFEAVRMVCNFKGWTPRLRVNATEWKRGPKRHGMDGLPALLGEDHILEMERLSR